MKKHWKRIVAYVMTLALLLTSVAGNIPVMEVNAASDSAASGFVYVDDGKFKLDGSDFYFAGTNNYYINFKPYDDVDAVMQDAEDMGLTVIRTWGHIDAGIDLGTTSDKGYRQFKDSIDGSGEKEGVYFQYFNPDTNQPEVNHGEDGLQHLDYVLYQAQKHNIKMIFTLTNYWEAFGGMAQYLKWAGKNTGSNDTKQELFYKDDQIKGWFKNYIKEVLNHENVYTGVKYKDDPTVFAWELCNEPRNDETKREGYVEEWASEMSAYIKSLDSNHMVSVGDEGGMHYTDATCPSDLVAIKAMGKQEFNGGMGDYEALMKIDTIDFGTPHLYVSDWNFDAAMTEAWVKYHSKIAHQYGKAVILEEFGWNASKDGRVYPERVSYYETLFNLAEGKTDKDVNYDGTTFWMLASNTVADSNGYYPNYDGYTIYGPNVKLLDSDSQADPTGTNAELVELVKQHAANMAAMGDRNSLDKSSGTFDKSSPADVTVTISPQTGSTLKGLTLDGNTMASSLYSVSGNTITFPSSALSSMEEGIYNIVIEMSVGSSLKYTLTVKDSSITDATVRQTEVTFDKNPTIAQNVILNVTLMMVVI